MVIWIQLLSDEIQPIQPLKGIPYMHNKKRLFWILPVIVLCGLWLMLQPDSSLKHEAKTPDKTSVTPLLKISDKEIQQANVANPSPDSNTSPIRGGYADLTPETLALGNELLASDTFIRLIAYDNIQQGLAAIKARDPKFSQFLDKKDVKTCLISLFQSQLKVYSSEDLNLMCLARILALPDFDHEREKITDLVKIPSRFSKESSVYEGYLQELNRQKS